MVFNLLDVTRRLNWRRRIILDLRSWNSKEKRQIVSVVSDPSEFKEKQLIGVMSQPAPGCNIYISGTDSKHTQFYFQTRLNRLYQAKLSCLSGITLYFLLLTIHGLIE